jgi:hypothetical protein
MINSEAEINLFTDVGSLKRRAFYFCGFSAGGTVAGGEATGGAVAVVFTTELAGISAGVGDTLKESSGLVNDSGIAEGGAAGGMPRAPTIAQCQSFDSPKLPPSGARKTVVAPGMLLPFK